MIYFYFSQLGLMASCLFMSKQVQATSHQLWSCWTAARLKSLGNVKQHSCSGGCQQSHMIWRDARRLHTIRATAFYHHHKEHPCHCCLWEAPLCTLAATCVHNRLGFQTQIIYMKGKAPVYVQPAPLCMPVGKYLFQYFKKQWVSTYFCAKVKAHSIKQVQIQFPLTGKCNKW